MKFKNDRIRDEWHSGKLSIELKDKINFWLKWLEWRAPGYEPTITDIYRSPEEYKAIYDDENRTPGIHTFWRAIDFRTSDMPDRLAYDSAVLLNTIPYDEQRPHLKTCLYGDERHMNHLHLQQMYKRGL